MSRRVLVVVAGLLVVATGTPARAAPPRAGDPPRPAARAGALEFGLAGVMLGVGVGLVAHGSIELVRTRELQRFCAQGNSGSGIDPCLVDPPGLGYAAVGLSWGFAVPLLVGSGLLFARGARVRAQASLAPWGRRSGAGLTFSLRF